MIELEIRPTARMRMQVFSLLALAVVISFVLVYLLTGGGRRLFERTSTLTTYMPDGMGLAPGSEVRLSGLSIGHVSRVDVSGSLDPQRVVRVDMEVNSRFLRNIPRDSETNISADTLVGYKFLGIDEGKSPLPVAERGELKSEPVRQASDRADLILSLENELRQADRLLIQISSPGTPIGQFIIGEAEYDRILTTISSFDRSIYAAVSPANQIGQVLFSDVMYRKIHDAVLHLDSILESIQKGEGTAGKLFASEEQYGRMVAQVKRLRAAVPARNAFLSDDRQYLRLQKRLHDTDALLSSIITGNGTVARLMDNAQLYQTLNTSLHELEALLKDFREHPENYLRYQVFNRDKKVPKAR